MCNQFFSSKMNLLDTAHLEEAVVDKRFFASSVNVVMWILFSKTSRWMLF
jgi:hypothetical protein